ncbi:MAG TPA: N-acetylglucosamine-6-phosphate deacetylase [Thermoanaerobaculia bacterium]|nr:N-acetylglucosamine-6-phosphate deacetylase [Thermoanaerobaculia bacterium]
MKGMLQLYGRAFVRSAIESDVLVTLIGDKIVEAVQVAEAPAKARRVDGLIVPGFVDVHVHGGDDADFMDGAEAANRRILEFHARHGTTALAATTLSGSRDDVHRAVKTIGAISSPTAKGCAEICAVHLEGPYISPARAGAQDRTSLRPADILEVTGLLAEAPDLAWIVTLAPEIEGARGLIEHFRDRIVFSIGHTAAGYGDTVAAIEWGASHFAHLFNAMTPLSHREPGVVGAAMLAHDTTAELIADGAHVHPAVLRIAAVAMPNRIALITDAMRACGRPDGVYRLYGHEAVVADGTARLADGTLAGSVLTMSRAVKNMVELAGLPLESVIPMASEVPARIIGVAARKGRIAADYDSDLVVLSERLEVESVFVRGIELASG